MHTEPAGPASPALQAPPQDAPMTTPILPPEQVWAQLTCKREAHHGTFPGIDRLWLPPCPKTSSALTPVEFLACSLWLRKEMTCGTIRRGTRRRILFREATPRPDIRSLYFLGCWSSLNQLSTQLAAARWTVGKGQQPPGPRWPSCSTGQTLAVSTRRRRTRRSSRVRLRGTARAGKTQEPPHFAELVKELTC